MIDCLLLHTREDTEREREEERKNERKRGEVGSSWHKQR
jgi:hypothetical protein